VVLVDIDNGSRGYTMGAEQRMPQDNDEVDHDANEGAVDAEQIDRDRIGLGRNQQGDRNDEAE